MAAADPYTFPQSLNRSIHQYTAARAPSNPSLFPAMAADPLPMDALELLQGATVDHTAWCCATGDKEKLPLLPLLWAISEDGTKLIAMAVDAHTDNSTHPKLHTVALPVHLHGFELFFSIGHLLLLEKRGSPSGIRLYNPFSSQFACLPPSTRTSFYFKILNVTVSTDTKCPIALATMASGVSYTPLVGTSASGHWIDLDPHIPIHPTSGRPISFVAPFVYTDGLFYGVDYTGTRVYAFDLTGAPGVKRFDKTFNLPGNYTHTDHCPDLDLCPHQSSSPTHTDQCPHIVWCCHQSARLITSASSLFLVRWRKTFGADPRKWMDVFRLDHRSNTWLTVSSLGPLSFFFGHNLPTSMSTADFPELKSNRVHLLSTSCPRISGGMSDCNDHGDYRTHPYYDLEDETWGGFPDAVSRIQIHCHPRFSVWMLPPEKGCSKRKVSEV